MAHLNGHFHKFEAVQKDLLCYMTLSGLFNAKLALRRKSHFITMFCWFVRTLFQGTAIKKVGRPMGFPTTPKLARKLVPNPNFWGRKHQINRDILAYYCQIIILCLEVFPISFLQWKNCSCISLEGNNCVICFEIDTYFRILQWFQWTSLTDAKALCFKQFFHRNSCIDLHFF